MAKTARAMPASRYDLKMPPVLPHEAKAEAIHSMLYDLTSAARTAANKKLPGSVRKAGHAARSHINKMHKAMMDVESTEKVKDNERKGE